MANQQSANDIVDNYEFLQKIGEGAFGEVWRARDKNSNEDVALKYLKLDRATKDDISLFKREFEILSEIRHAHIARVFDFGYSSLKDQYLFTTEYCPGIEFLAAAQGKPVSYIEEMLVQILAALDYVHSQGIVHFDIKSENILVSEKEGKPHVKILDFGVASRLKTLPQGILGTPSYMAPEIVIKGAKVDHRADLYSLGMLLLRALTKRLPFDTEDIDSVMRWHLKGDLPEEIWQDVEIPRYLRNLIEKLLQKKPSDRFSNARVALHFINASTGRKYEVVEQNLEGKIPREGPLIERDDVMKELTARFESSLSSPEKFGVPQVSVISGAQGMGKSRLIQEIRRIIELKETPFLEVVCDWQIPAWPKIEKWLGIASIVTPDMNEDWKLKVRINALVEGSKSKPFCLLIDDFHKADRATKTLVPSLANKLAQLRTEGNPAPIFVIVATEEIVKDALSLKRISSSGIAGYIGLVLGESERNADVAKLLHQYSGGLPLLMVEGLRFLAPHLYKNDPLENLLPPPQIGLLYSEKIKSLKPDEYELLSILALLFRPAGEEELANILKTSRGTIAQIAEEPLRTELLSGGRTIENEPAVYQVSSQALSLDIIKSIEPKYSQKIHKKIAEGLMQMMGVPLNEIAYHTAKGGDVSKAIHFYRDASANYKKVHEIASATDCLTKAIDLCQQGAEEWKELLRDAAQLLIVSGSFREAELYLGKIKDHDTASIEELRGMLAMKEQNFALARESYKRALSLTPKSELLQRILIENSLGNVQLLDGKFAESVELFRKTLDAEKSLEPNDIRRVTNNSLGLALAMKGDTEEALEFYRNQINRLEPDRIAELVQLENGMGYVLYRASRYEEAIPHLRKALELAEKSGAFHALFSTLGNLISALLKEARYAESLPLLQKMTSYQTKLGSPRDIIYNLLREGSVYVTLGMDEAAQICLQKGRTMAQDTHDLTLASWFLLMDGYREREYGELDKAREFFMLAELEARERQDNDLVAWAHYSLADMAFDSGDREDCMRQLESINEIPADEEFILRLKLLRAKLNSSIHNRMNELFGPIEEESKKNNLKELLWEVYYSWANAELNRGNREGALSLLLKGIKVIEGIASGLPEEYRDRYISQRSRKMLFDDFKELTSPQKATNPKISREVFTMGEAKPREGTVAEGPSKPAAERTTAEGPSQKPASEGTIAEDGGKRSEDEDEETIKVPKES